MKKSTALAVDEILELLRTPYELEEERELNLIFKPIKSIPAANKTPFTESVKEKLMMVPMLLGDPMDNLSERLSQLHYSE